MGRPLNKRYFNDGDGTQLSIRAFVTGGSEGVGKILKQTGSRRYIVDVDGDIGTVFLVDKDNGDLVAGDATITFKNADSDEKRVMKLMAHRANFFDDTSAAWSFDPATGDTWEAADVEDGFAEIDYVITIDAQPETAIVGAFGDPASFTIEASVIPDTELSYEWQASGEGWYSLIGEPGFENADTATLSIPETDSGMNEMQIRCIVYVDNLEGGVVSDTVQLVFD